MKSSALLIAGLALVVLVAGSIFGCGKGGEGVSGAAAPAEGGVPVEGTSPAGETEIAQEVCPVMGGPIDKNIYADYEGRRVYFCCQMCVGEFKKAPEKYLGKLDEQLRTAPESGEGQTETRPAHATEVAQKLCPVMGGAINQNIFVDYTGRRVYFCCGGCPTVFKEDPETYLKVLDSELQGEPMPRQGHGPHESL